MKNIVTFVISVSILSAYVVSGAWWPPQEPEEVCNQPSIHQETDWQHACLNSANWCNLLLHDRDFRRRSIERTYGNGFSIECDQAWAYVDCCMNGGSYTPPCPVGTCLEWK